MAKIVLTFEDQADTSYKVYLSASREYVLEDMAERIEEEDPSLTGAEIAAYYAYMEVIRIEENYADQCAEQDMAYDAACALQDIEKVKAAPDVAYKWPDHRYMTKH